MISATRMQVHMKMITGIAQLCSFDFAIVP
jgi:hypothetical protein